MGRFKHDNQTRMLKVFVSQLLKKTVLAIASVGVVLPNAALAATPAQAAPVVRDVALEQGGVLNGQVISAQGAVQSKTQVTLLKNGQPIAKLLTDENGRFAASGLRGGVYIVTTQGTQGVVRAWAPRTAPPSAVRGLLLVPAGEVVNGIFGHEGWGHPEIGHRALILGGIMGISGVIGGVIGYNVRDAS